MRGRSSPRLHPLQNFLAGVRHLGERKMARATHSRHHVIHKAPIESLCMWIAAFVIYATFFFRSGSAPRSSIILIARFQPSLTSFIAFAVSLLALAISGETDSSKCSSANGQWQPAMSRRVKQERAKKARQRKRRKAASGLPISMSTVAASSSAWSFTALVANRTR
jgi:hypothetical protein